MGGGGGEVERISVIDRTTGIDLDVNYKNAQVNLCKSRRVSNYCKLIMQMYMHNHIFAYKSLIKFSWRIIIFWQKYCLEHG